MTGHSTPGIRWPLILGAAGFAAGFLGPLVFVPDANQGPLVGILLTGPCGAVIGLVMWIGCRMLGVAARTQWRTLLWTTIVGVIATLLAVQPGPQIRGYVYEAKVSGCSAPLDAETEVLRDWRERIAQANWATARSGWEHDMHVTLANAPGVLVTVGSARRKSILELRKPWNRGRLSGTGWSDVADEKTFHAAQEACADFPVRREVRIFERYALNGRIETPKDWPPTSLSEVLGVSPYLPVPAEYAGL